LFTIARFDTLRVYFNLPQNEAALLIPGSRARITVQTFPGRIFYGIVAHSTVVLDPGSRTLVAEIDMINPKGILRPGMFAMVQLSIPQPRGVLLIPDSALVTGTSGTQVITVDSNNKLHFQKIQVGDDNGQEIEVLSGLSGNSSIVSAPSNGLTEGETVQPTESAKKA
jgi:RND family efflux transporter MFP subunit